MDVMTSAGPSLGRGPDLPFVSYTAGDVYRLILVVFAVIWLSIRERIYQLLRGGRVIWVDCPGLLFS